MITFYGYDRCSTCRKAKKALDGWNVEYRDIDITEKPPTKKVLRALLASGDYRLADLFNRSGVQYRELNMKEKLKAMSDAEAIELLAGNGRLCKRPIVTDGSKHSVGFKEDVFRAAWK